MRKTKQRIWAGVQSPVPTKMTRRKFRNSQRSEPPASRSFQEYILDRPAPQTSRSELLRLIRGGEDTYLELKVKLSNPEKITQGIVALANTDGGVIVFGVTDQLKVEGVDDALAVRDELVRICRDEVIPPLVPLIDTISFDNGRQVVLLEVEGKRRPYRTRDGRFYLRLGAEKREISRRELSTWLEEIRPLGYENIPVAHSGMADIDDALLWSFVRTFAADLFEGILPHFETDEVLKKDLLLAVNYGDEIVPTIAAILLFGKNQKVAELFPRSSVTITRFTGELPNQTIVERQELSGNLLSIYESSLRFISRYCDLKNEKTAPVRTFNGHDPLVSARANYLRTAVQEAIANALVHRDLVIRDITTRINIYDSMIEVINPRRTSGFVPPAARAIRYGISQSLNPQIKDIFGNAAYGADISRGGLPVLLRESRLFAGRRPDILTSNDEFKLKIYGK
jgi:ATP-dependent DNA helicase RecG